jgi:thiamine kinase-like enzyme
LYIVHVKNVKASEARKHWFRLLDEALRGEVIAVERKGQRVVLRREEPSVSRSAKATQEYKKLLKVPRADEADRWSWDWRPERRLVPRRRSTR